VKHTNNPYPRRGGLIIDYVIADRESSNARDEIIQIRTLLANQRMRR
jgi:hypothetical protein